MTPISAVVVVGMRKSKRSDARDTVFTTRLAQQRQHASAFPVVSGLVFFASSWRPALIRKAVLECQMPFVSGREREQSVGMVPCEFF